jgi:hypothetical protein
MADAQEETNDDFAGIFGLMAAGCFLAGFGTFVSCGDHAQTSKKTLTLLSLAAILAVPPLDSSFNKNNYMEIIFYSLNVLIVCYLFFVMFFQKDSLLNKTYDKQLDSFPHAWLTCFMSSVGIAVCIFWFLDFPSNDDDSFAGCKDDFAGDVLSCTYLSLHLTSSTLYMLAFVPQVYIVFKIWAGHAHESAGMERNVYFKVKLFLALMFASFALKGFMWIFWAISSQNFDTDVFVVFFSTNAVAAIVTTMPWLVRATCMQCLRCTTCPWCIKKPSRDGPQDGTGNSHIRVNTGQSNDNAIEKAEEQKKSNSWFTSSSSGKETAITENDPPDEERNVGVVRPEQVVGSSSSSSISTSPTSWQQSTTSSLAVNNSYSNKASPTIGGGGGMTPGSVASSASSSYYSGGGDSSNMTTPPPPGGGGGADRPDWLQDVEEERKCHAATMGAWRESDGVG